MLRCPENDTEYSANSSSVEGVDVSIDQHEKMETHLQVGVNKLCHESPQAFSKPVYILKTVDDSVEGEWEQRLQQAYEKRDEAHIALIPYYLGQLHWTGVLIEFKQTGLIERAEFIDPVINSTFSPNQLKNWLLKLNPAVPLFCKPLKKHGDREGSASMVVENLLEAASQNILDSRVAISNDQEISTSYSQRTTSELQQDVATTPMSSNRQGNKFAFSHSQNTPSYEGQQTCAASNKQEIIHQPDEKTLNKYSPSSPLGDRRSPVDRNPAMHPHSPTHTHTPRAAHELQVLKQKLETKFAERDITDEQELEKQIEEKKEKIKTLESKGNHKAAERQRESLSELEDIQSLVDRMKALKPPPPIDELQVLKQKLEAKFAEHDITDEQELEKQIEEKKEKIKTLESKGNHKVAERQRESLSELEDIQSLVDRMKALKPPPPIDELQVLKQKLEAEFAEHDITDEQELEKQIEEKKEKIKTLESKGNHKAAERQRESLSELEDIQSLVDRMKALKPPPPIDELQVLKQKLEAKFAEHDITDEQELEKQIEEKKEKIKTLESKGNHKVAERKRESLSELEDIQSLVDRMKALKPPPPIDELQVLKQKLEAKFAEHDITDEQELEKQIEEKKEKIKTLESKGNHKAAERQRESLSELEDIQSSVDRMKALKPPPPIDELQVLKQKLEAKFAEHDITDEQELEKQIEEKKEKIKTLESKGNHKAAERQRESLSELEDIQSLVDRMKALKPPPPIDELQVLKQKLEAKFAEHDITDEQELEKQIEEKKEKIKTLESKGNHKAAERQRESLSELEDIQSSVDRMKALKPPPPIDELQVLKQKLEAKFAEHDITDEQELEKQIEEKKEKIKTLESKGNHKAAERQRESLSELEDIQSSVDRMKALKPASVSNDTSGDFEGQSRALTPVPTQPFCDTTFDWKGRSELCLADLRGDLVEMPACAEKSTMELVEYFERMPLDDCAPGENGDAVCLLLAQLQDQLKKQELVSDETRNHLQALHISVHARDYSSAARSSERLLEKIRPLNIPEINRLVGKTKKAGKVIYDKDIVLLVGPTGAGKSTTVQFLAGGKMEKIGVEVAPGRFLKHITAVGLAANHELSNIKSSPLKKSETRYITAVTIAMKDIYGPSKVGEIILCDAPGLGDTAGPEVEIANGVGIIEALKGCKSVKLLVLSNIEDSGARGQGIARLAHILVNMIKNIASRLDSIFYGFTKYSEETSINAELIAIRSDINRDLKLRLDSAFLTVLDDMIQKTASGAAIIDPLHGDRKILIEKLNSVTGIEYPGEVFRFSMNEQTQKTIANQVQQYELSIRCAVKHKDFDLVVYYLENLKTLQEIIQKNFIRDAYEKSLRFISGNIDEYCKEVMKKFNRAVESLDGLREEDIREYKTSVKYIEGIQKTLGVYVESGLISPAALLQNITSELQKGHLNLQKEDLYSRLVEVYLHNLRMLKNSFREFEAEYSKSCTEVQCRFGELVKSAREPILKNEFSLVAEIMLRISKSSHVLKNYLGEKVEEKYIEVVKSFLKHLCSFSEKADPILEKIRLNDSDVEILNDYMQILRSAKETVPLQERISTFAEMLKNNPDVCEAKFQNLNDIYNELIEKIIKYFDEINVRIKGLFDKNGDFVLEQIQKLVGDMELIRKIPELEAKTAGTYYRTVENVRGYMQQLQQEAAQLIVAIDQKSGVTNYAHLARSLSRLKNAEWIDRVSPGAYDAMMRRITEELVQHAQELEERLMKLDFHLRCPNGICAAHDIVAKIESMRILERSVPELEKYRTSITDRFRQTIEGAFDRIQQTFNLQDKAAYSLKQELKRLEQIKREYESLHPACKYLHEQEYPNMEQLNREIENLKIKQQEETSEVDALKQEKEKQLKDIDGIIRQYMDLTSENSDQGVLGIAIEAFTGISKKIKLEAQGHLKKYGYQSIAHVYEAQINTSKEYDNKLRLIQDNCTGLDNSLNRLQEIRKKYNSLLLVGSSSIPPEGMRFLKEKGEDSIESLDEQIQKKAKSISELEKNKQIYGFIDRLDASAADHALLYVSECEKVGHFRVKETAAETNANLQEYIKEYGKYLNQEIDRLYKNTNNIDVEGGPFQYSHDLSIRLEELSSLNKFADVFKCIDGVEKIGEWKQEFFDCYRSLSSKMEEYKSLSDAGNLRKHSIIVQALYCLDKFCNDNKFNELYKKHQINMHEDFRETYKNVLNYTSKCDYANAAMTLSEIDDKPLNQKAQRQIQYELQSSLTKLMKDTTSMAHWLYGKIEREEENRAQIKEIKDNVEKIRTASSKTVIVDLLDDKSKNDLMNFDTGIDQILSEIIIKGLCSMEKFMVTDNFAEAEQGMENISHVQRSLIGYCTSDAVIKKTEELKEKLSRLVDTISTRDFTDIEKYFVNPPRDLLARLKSVAAHDPRYARTYTTLLGQLKVNFSEAIDKVRLVPRKERSTKLRALNYALCFVPDELQHVCKMHIEEMNENMKEEEQEHTRELHVALKSPDENEHTITKIGELAKRFQEKDMDEFSEKLHEEITKRLQIYRANLQASLDQNDMQSALDIMDKIIKFKGSVSKYIPGIKGIYDNARNSTIKSFENCSKLLADIAKIEKPEIVEKAFSNTIVCVDFSNALGTADEEFLPKTALQNCNKDFQAMRSYLNDNSEKYREALKAMTVDELHTTMTISKRWDTLLQEIKQCSTKNSSVKSLLPDVQNVVMHTEMISGVEKVVSHLETQLDVELISDDTTKFEKKREDFFSKLNESTNLLKEIDSKLKDILPTPVNVENSTEKLKRKVTRIGEQLLEVASKSELTQVECDRFRKYYDHLLVFKKHLNLSGVDVESSLDQSKAKIFEKVTCVGKEFVDAGANVQQAASTLIKMKSFAENLSMFDTEINAQLDEALKVCKVKNGPAYLTLLTTGLENTDVGARIMSEHSLLKGQDWRKRKEKMQHQDDLDYILGLLEGDNLDKNTLKVRYVTFKRKYDAFISSNLQLNDQESEKESNLNALISNTKCLVDKVAKNSTRLILNQSFKDKVPELLAHIFAIWTLQNTEYYNAARGIESQDAYLLTPHVAQILAIFRILGIGYENSESATTLFNNLVQIGTGEGKSVVMAVTACVFALTGVDVNCSCYSEVLSMRDRDSFASLFRALGIESHIEYGTFNKLCENLLNEQCNVREKVSDMILTNQNALNKIETTERKRPKVLLIDEVDVFISDKYYGGVYTPVVYLNHPDIKSLLDTLWTNRTIRTLNGIKTMPAYRVCANRFSNWTFLLDEAIKDMIAALQSFQSSTYHIQNDKIAYVEGESISENVVRGYDTTWAYYHEHSKSKISASSLANNVGIIVNCGTFSYAEMPHDFAYISGVTGTLKTLATSEKAILAKVYAVSKNTYMPSVFGSCRRNYNPTNDVRAVSETEYFMGIRGEIDVMCNAKRAILVFFESEDKLMKFYISSNLSTIKESVQIITEKVSVKDRELYIKRAATIEKVTLLTPTFGRGTDFVCSNQQLLANGGIHVLQTFFSEELSEEYQIMGRGARQGDSGSYRMILLDKDLEWVLGACWAVELPKILGTTLYENLNKARNSLFESKCGSKGLGIEQCKREHIASKNFMSALNDGKIEVVKQFLTQENQGANINAASSRTVLLMDATGSMSSLLSAAKETVCTMFERAADILNQLGLPSDAFQLQFVVYRDYDCKEDGILQISSWETKPNNLRNFMKHIVAMGGGDYEEAIEIGLWYAVQQSEQPDEISQVVLIGDAPAKERPAIARDRNAYGGEAHWSKTKYKTPTYYIDELQKLKAKNIPVHAFYLDDGAKENFQRIARETSGRSELLLINSKEGAALLTNLVTEEILRKTAGDQGNASVELYRKKYVKGFTS